MYTRDWIINNSVEIISQYDKGILTLRGLHYRLVASGMTNSIQHYKRVVSAMIKARWDGIVDFNSFSDHDRSMIGSTSWFGTSVEEEVIKGKKQVRLWMNNYFKNRWENQPCYPEIFIEKKALQGVFGPVCEKWNITLGACKGYPSLTFLNEAHYRFDDAFDNEKIPIILYFGDYDPSGEDIPRSIKENLHNLGTDVEVKRIALMKDQVLEWKLPPAPAKITDSRTAKWDGLGQVELDAVDPDKIQSLCNQAIESIFDEELYDELMEQEESEKIIYRKELKEYVNGL